MIMLMRRTLFYKNFSFIEGFSYSSTNILHLISFFLFFWRFVFTQCAHAWTCEIILEVDIYICRCQHRWKESAKIIPVSSENETKSFHSRQIHDTIFIKKDYIRRLFINIERIWHSFLCFWAIFVTYF